MSIIKIDAIINRMHNIFLVLSVFLASMVEGVEALTIVLAMGTTRGWRSTWYGIGAAFIVLALFVAILGPALTLIPISALRLAVGGLLLTFLNPLGGPTDPIVPGAVSFENSVFAIGAAAVRYIGRGIASAVPEISTWAMMILGMGGIGATLRRRRSALALA